MKPRKLSYFLGLFGLLFVATSAFAEEHFKLQMENRTDRNVTISFQSVEGDVTLAPQLLDNTALPSHQFSEKYGVNLVPANHNSNFNIVFTGRKSCTFNVGFFAPGKPKITTYGLGCSGCGYRVIDNNHTLLLYITEIAKAS